MAISEDKKWLAAAEGEPNEQGVSNIYLFELMGGIYKGADVDQSVEG